MKEKAMDLTKDNLNHIFVKYLFMALGSAVMVSVYSSVDMICVGHSSGPAGTAAISCINPLWSIMIAAGLLLGIGGSVWMSNMRGSQKKEEGDAYFSLAIWVGLTASLVLTAFFMGFRRPLMVFFGANEEILPFAMEYSFWIAISTPFFLMGALLQNFIRNDGRPGLCTAATLAGGIFNIFGDIYFVFDFGLGMGMAGAGLATALGQILTTLILCTHFFGKSCGLKLCRVKGGSRLMKHIVSAGFAPAIVDLTFGIFVIIFNRQITRYAGSNELAVFSTIANLALFVQSLFYGVGQAVQPIVSINFGAGLSERVKIMRRTYLKTTIGMGMLFFALIAVFPSVFLRIYMAVTPEILDIGVYAFRIYAVSFLFMGVNVVSTYYLESVLRANVSLVISLLRGVILSALFVMLLPAVFGFSAIWWTMPLAEGATFLVTVWLVILRKDSEYYR